MPWPLAGRRRTTAHGELTKQRPAGTSGQWHSARQAGGWWATDGRQRRWRQEAALGCEGAVAAAAAAAGSRLGLDAGVKWKWGLGRPRGKRRVGIRSAVRGLGRRK